MTAGLDGVRCNQSPSGYSTCRGTDNTRGLSGAGGPSAVLDIISSSHCQPLNALQLWCLSGAMLLLQGGAQLVQLGGLEPPTSGSTMQFRPSYPC